MNWKKFLLGLFSVSAACFAAELLPDPGLARFSGDSREELKYWQITLKGKKAAAAVKGAGRIEFSSGGGLVVVSGRNFRLDADKFKNGNILFSAAAAGQGEARFSFYCYNRAGRFIKSHRCGSKPFGDAAVSVPAELPEGTAFLVPVLTLSGAGSVKKISCGTPSAASFVHLLPEDFSRRPVEERIRLIDGSTDWRVPWAVLALEDTPDDPERQVRFRAAYRLGSFGEAALPCAETLASQLTHRNEAVRVHAASALTRLGKGAFPFIRNALLSNNFGVRLCMANTVRGMPGGTPPELAGYVRWASPPHALSGPSFLPDSSFEASRNDALYGWRITFEDGAEGRYEVVSDRARTGRQSLKIVKTNGKGYILLASAFPVTIPAGNGKKPWIFRLHYRCGDASYNSLLLPRFLKPDGSIQWHDTRFFGGAGWQGQSVLVNTPGAAWGKRLILAGLRKYDQPLRPAVVLYGNPVTVYLDDLEFPAREIDFADAGRTYSTPGHTLEETLRRIAGRPAVTARIGRTSGGKSVLELNGKTVSPVFMLSFNGALGDCELFCREVGIRQPVVTVNMRSSCRYPPFRGIRDGSGKLDFSPLFEIIESALCKAPESSPVLGINVAFPDDFVEKNPEEAYLDARGQRACGTPGVVTGFAKTLPKGGNLLWWPSQFSEKARESSGVILRKFLEELVKKPYAKVISGVFISGGHDGQFFIPFRDYGPAATRAWRRFLKERYGNDDTLRRAWRDPAAAIATAAVPPETDGNTLPGNWYDPATSRRQMDFKEFEERQIWLNSGYYLALCKAAFGREILGFSWCFGGTWSQNFDALYGSKGHDLFAAQPMYHYRPAGYSGGLNMVADSNGLHGKMAVSELDLRSWLRGSGYAELYGMKIGTPLNQREMRSVMLKESGRMIAAYQGLWFYDMGNGTFRAPETVSLMKTVRETADRVFENAGSDDFTPDTVWVTFQNGLFGSVPLGGGKRGNHSGLMTEEMMWALRGSGVFPATMLMSDLMKEGRHRRFRVFVLLNPVHLTDEEKTFVREKLLKDGRTVVWVGGTGTPGGSRGAGDGASLTGIETTFDPALSETLVLREKADHPLLAGVPETLGVADAYRRRFELGKEDPWHHRLPRWIVTDKKAVTLARYASGESAVAVRRHKDFTAVFCGVPGALDPVLFYNIVRAAGGYAVARPGVVADMNGNFLSLHALKAGRYPLSLPPGRTRLVDAETGKEVKEHAIVLDAGESRWFEFAEKVPNKESPL